jgi:hypothetical protein
LLDDYEKEVKGIKKAALSLSWYTRGGVSYEDVLNMSTEERQLINEMADDHFETTKKTQLPYF